MSNVRWGFNAHMPFEKYLWEYSFDLDCEKLRCHYGKNTINHGWDDIYYFLTQNGFDNKDDKQGSCYFTSTMMSPQKANAIIRKMFKELPWLPFCIRRDALTIRETNVFSNKEYAERLIKSKNHIKRLITYYERIGVQKGKMIWQADNCLNET